ncbi:MAG TPA: hypothetical protein VLE45_08690 [Burkholderiaceae bacterium]|nr:hypothetical protein [Burkholderiaceae bacterium]
MASVVARTLMAVGTLAALAAGPAHATNVAWSVGIQAPIGPGVSVGTVITNGIPVVAAPVYVPPPVVMPAPVYAPPVYAPPVYAQPVYAQPVFVPRVVYGPPVWVGGRWVRHPVHRPYPVAWYPGYGHGHHGPPARMPGREVRY